ncbi:c-type cytochrome domain-containing protein [Spirosoma sp. KNUC1025]|uniref:c-type cytochrome domain-containing protein n=1 Tax=Spirosoma sp. KNUC1025 TaxID=2894082 RepID=UPI00386D59C3|nr:ribonuclease inhibitor [Spirosoma sp. KNUC1025]
MNTLILLQAATFPSEWVLFLGHFHPLLVHLPIGFLLIAGLLELDRLTRRKSVSQHTITLILFWSAVSATMACGFGYMLSLGGGYDAETLDAHMWQGIGVAVFAWVAWSVKSENLGRIVTFAPLLYLPALGIALVFLLSAGHLGGNLTHGSDYLTQFAPGPIRTLAGLPPKQPDIRIEPITDVNQAMVYQQIVNPILQARCVQCHNADKSKAGLRLDSPDKIKRGSEDGPILVVGNSKKSKLVSACLLPEDDDHHMPPKGKPQLTDSQIALLTWWIDQGATFDRKVTDLTVNDAIRPVLASLGGNGPLEKDGQNVAEKGRNDGQPAPESPVLTMKMPAADPKGIEEVKQTGLLVLPLSKEQNQLEVSAVNAHTFNDAQAATLLKLSHQIVWLKLGDTEISDATLAQVAKLKNLQKLHLEQTNITDAGLKKLSVLANLEYLNLYGTEITDAGLADLVTLKNLKTIYLWQTKTTQKGKAMLKKAMPTLDIVDGISEQSLAELTKLNAGPKDNLAGKH